VSIKVFHLSTGSPCGFPAMRKTLTRLAANNNYHVAIKNAMVANIEGPLAPIATKSASAHHATATAHADSSAHVIATESAAAAQKEPKADIAPATKPMSATTSEDAPAPAARVNSRIFRL
jgi:hypothetical protein